MYGVKFASEPRILGGFATEAKAKWWAFHESDGDQFTVVPLTPAA